MQKISDNIQVFLSAVVLLTFLFLAQIYGTSFVWNSSLIIFTLLSIIIICFTALFQKKHTILSTFKNWSPLLVIIIGYENLREFTGVVNPHPIDQTLYEMDLKLFGIEPTIWAGQFVNPVLTDIFSLFYAAYFLMPLLLAFYLYWKQHQNEFLELSLALQFCFCIGFLLYIVFPAGPPRFYFDASVWQAYPPLYGYWGLFEHVHAVADAHNPVKHYASFPSLHVTLAVLPLMYVIKFKRVLWVFFIPFYWVMSTGIIASTLYLRHHWVPDILAGIVLAVVSFKLSSIFSISQASGGLHPRLNDLPPSGAFP